MQLKCEQCGAPLQAADLHLDRGIAVCSACGGVLHLPDRGGGEAKNSPTRAAKPKGDVPVPVRFAIEDDGHELLIRYRWFHPAVLFLLFFAIAWDSFLVFWYSMAFGGIGPPGAFGLIMILFPIAHVAVGVGLTYFVIASLLNTTHVRIADGTLSVRHGPVPWRGNLDLVADEIEQVYCKRNTKRNRDDGGSVSSSMNYEVCAVVGERQVRLLGMIMEPDQALFVEQRIERFLRIEDRPVPGELEA